MSVARQFALTGREVLIPWVEVHLGTEISSRSSKLIDARLQCSTGSCTARLCVRGTELLYRNCAERSAAHCRIGNLQIAGVE